MPENHAGIVCAVRVGVCDLFLYHIFVIFHKSLSSSQLLHPAHNGTVILFFFLFLPRLLHCGAVLNVRGAVENISQLGNQICRIISQMIKTAVGISETQKAFLKHFIILSSAIESVFKNCSLIFPACEDILLVTVFICSVNADACCSICSSPAPL